MGFLEQVEKAVLVVPKDAEPVQFALQYVGLGAIRACLVKELIDMPLVRVTQSFLLGLRDTGRLFRLLLSAYRVFNLGQESVQFVACGLGLFAKLSKIDFQSGNCGESLMIRSN